MMTGFRITSYLLLLALLAIAQSCAGIRDQRSPNTPARNSSRAAMRATEQIAAGTYQDAIDTYASAYRGRSRDKSLATEYAQGLTVIKARADAAAKQKNFAAAGGIYDVLIRNYSRFEKLGPMLSFDRQQLDARLSRCKESLAAQGFQEYREGNLDEAIAIWQSLLAIDPGNADIKGAVKTAKQQRKNLEERANGK